MLKRLKNKKGFTLAELLIVVAIIGVLVAISVPIFTSQLKKSRLATNQANARAAKSAVVASLLENEMDSGYGVYDTATGKLSGTVSSTSSKGSVSSTSSKGSLDTDPSKWTVDSNASLASSVYSTWTVYIDNKGNATYSFE